MYVLCEIEFFKKLNFFNQTLDRCKCDLKTSIQTSFAEFYSELTLIEIKAFMQINFAQMIFDIQQNGKY